MKIWCDVCDKEEASVYCSADEAALCNGCDGNVHSANKLSRKHLRFSLTSPSFKDAPICDICTERRALLFCQQDRAILCRECDISKHQSNDHTKKHNRFLLTGVKISDYPTPTASSSGEVPRSVSNKNSPSSNCYSGSISEYLMETLPGWRVEDLLEHPSCLSYEANTDSYRVYDASSQYHPHGLCQQIPFS